MSENKARIETAQKAIREVIKISDLFKEYKRFIDPVWRGNGDYMICCPFHGDRSPSLGISDNIGKWSCFGCTAKGDAVTAFMWLARTVDHASYSYSEAIDQLIARNIRLRENLPFDTVIDKTVSMEDILNRPKLKYRKTALDSPKTINDVFLHMQKTGKTSFIDIAYITSMMVGKQDPVQLLLFLGEESAATKPASTTQEAGKTAADLLHDVDWGMY